MTKEVLQKTGAEITWGSAGGESEVLTLANLATTGVREGEEHDFTDTHAPCYMLFFRTDFAAAPTAGLIVEIYFAWSHDGTLYDGVHGGADAGGATTKLPNMHLVHVHICTNDTDEQYSSAIISAPSRYGAPAVYNASGQTMQNTAANHELILVPLIPEIQ